MFTVFIGRRGAYALQLTSCQSGFKHITGIYGTFCCSRSHYCMHFINEQDNFTPGLANFIHHRLQPFLKFTAELAAGYQRTHIQCNDLAVLQ